MTACDRCGSTDRRLDATFHCSTCYANVQAALTAAEQQVAELRGERDKLRVADGLVLELQRELDDMYENGWPVVRVCEGGGPENLAATVALLANTLRRRAEEAEAARDAAREETARVRAALEAFEEQAKNIRAIAARGRSFGHQATPQTHERMVERKDGALVAILERLALVGFGPTCLRAAALNPTPPQPAPEEVQPRRAAVCVACGQELKGYSPNDTSTWRTDDFCSARCKRRGQPAARTEEGL